MILRIVGLLALALTLGLTVPAEAQTPVEPAAEDLNELLAALSSTLAEPVFAFDIRVEAHVSVEGDAPVDLTLSGEGAIDLLGAHPAFTLNLRGQSADSSGETTIDSVVRVVNEAIYFSDAGDSPDPGHWQGARFADFQSLFEAQFSANNVQMVETTAQLQQLADLFPASGVQFSDLMTLTREPDEMIDGAPTGHLALHVDLARFARKESFAALLENFSVQYLGESLGANGMAIAVLIGALLADTSIRLDALIDPGAGLLWGAEFTLDSVLDPALIGQTGAPVTTSLHIAVNFRDFGVPHPYSVPDGITLLAADELARRMGFAPDQPAAPTPAVTVPTPAGTRLVAVLTTPNATPRPRITLTPTQPPATEAPTAAPSPTTAAAPAQSLPPNAPVQFVLAPGTAAEFIYSGARGDVITLSARSLDAAAGLDPVLELLDAGGVRLGFNDDLTASRPGFGALDAVLPNVKLPADGDYIVRVNSLDAGATGPVELLASTLNDTAPTPEPRAATASYPIITVSESSVPANGEDCATVELLAGETLTAAVRALDPILDPSLRLYAQDGSQIAFNDDHGSSDPNLARFDSRISGVDVTTGGPHRLCVTGFAGSAGAYELTVIRNGGSAVSAPTATPAAVVEPTPAETGDLLVINDVIQPNTMFFTPIAAEAGDVYTLTVQALDPALDPQVGLFLEDENEPLYVNDDHNSSSPELAYYDARITNLIIPQTGTYDVAVAGYQDSAGPFELTIERTARGGPLGEPGVETVSGKVESNGVYLHEVTLPAGAYVTITVAAVDSVFDPQVTLITPDGVIATDNDDHSSGDPALQQSDSRIHHYFVGQSGVYTIEIRGFRGSGGFFTLTIATLE